MGGLGRNVSTISPDGTKVFVGWYDCRNDPENSEIEVWGAIADLPVDADSFQNRNFRISTVAFPPVFAGTAEENTVPGKFDPAYPPEDRTDGQCPTFGGSYSHHMGDYDMAFADDQCIYYSWADNRDYRGSRQEANVRMARIPWE